MTPNEKENNEQVEPKLLSTEEIDLRTLGEKALKKIMIPQEKIGTATDYEMFNNLMIMAFNLNGALYNDKMSPEDYEAMLEVSRAIQTAVLFHDKMYVGKTNESVKCCNCNKCSDEEGCTECTCEKQEPSQE